MMWQLQNLVCVVPSADGCTSAKKISTGMELPIWNKIHPLPNMQGVCIFIQLLLAEGQEQNSDLTRVYIIFIQKSNISIHSRVFPKHDPISQGRQGASHFWASNKPGLAKLFARKSRRRNASSFSRNSIRRSAEGCQRPSLKEPRYCGTFCWKK